MSFHLRLTALLLLGAIPCAAQQSDPASLVPQLLALPAPAPPAGLPNAPVPHNNAWNVPVFSAPVDDAPIEVLCKYYGEQSSSSDHTLPPDKVRERLLSCTKENPELLYYLIALLPDTPATWSTAKAVYDANSSRFGKDWNEKVRQFLEFHSDFFRSELIAAAASAHDAKDAGYVEHSDELEALAKLDWQRASPILQRLASGRAQRAACLALTLQYRHAVQTDDASAFYLRDTLKKIVEDHARPGYCRDQAADAIFSTTWPDRDDWYLSLFHDDSLRSLLDNSYMTHPLTDVVSADPDHWIPIMVRLLASPDRATHDNAVAALVQFNLRSARKDALEPLIPWLSDKNWSSADDRLRLIQSVDQLDLTASVPGLISIVANEDFADREYAAEALQHFKDERAVPALRAAMAKEKDFYKRRRIIKALIASNGVQPAEAAQAVEDYAAATLTPKDQETFEEAGLSMGRQPTSPSAGLGAELSESTPPPAVVEILIDRARELQAQKPALADRLRALIAAWSASAADAEITRRLSAGELPADAIAIFLNRRSKLDPATHSALQSLASSTNSAAGIAAVAISDKPSEAQVLEGNDVLAKSLMFAAARLVREPLELDKVSPYLAAADHSLSTAAEAYLSAEDSSAARQAILSHHPGEALILGARDRSDPGHDTYPAFDKIEAQLRSEVQHSPASEEVFALLSAGYWGSAGQIIIRVYGTKANVALTDRTGKSATHAATVGDLAKLQQFITVNHVDDLGPLNLAVCDGIQFEYFHLTRDGGRRVFMNNPGLGGSGGSTYDLLHSHFVQAATASH